MKTPVFKRVCLSVWMAVSVLFAHGQQLQKQSPHQCYFDELMLEQIKNNPAVLDRMHERDQLINEFIHQKHENQFPGIEKTLNATLIIPVVVYVVHEYGPENITDLQVTSQIDALNAYYEDYGIQFCLATKKGAQNLTSISTPSGITSTTPGIFHYGDAALTNHNVSQQAALTAISSTLPAHQYLRIWVVKGITSNTLPPGQKILGYSMLPEFAASATDGIVMSYDAFGDVATCSCSTLEPYSELGRIMVHEAGHYLGLYHTFHGGCQGMTTSDCATLGDKVCDTPPVNAPNSGCPSATWNTCSESPNFPDDIHNYMDYVSESCMTGFTEGQNDRILAQINLFRSNLVSPGNLIYTGVSCNGGLLSDFGVSNYSPCVNTSITFTAIASPGATYTWDFGDGTTGSGVTTSHTYTGVYSPASVVLTIDNGVNSVSSTQMVFVDACAPINPDQGHWYYGQRGGMDFSPGAPIYDNASYVHNNYIDEACAVQSNSQGDLLFYTNGIEVWDANHAHINSGNPLKSGLSAHRGALILPNLANPSQYYIFTKDQGRFNVGQTLTIPDSNGFRYSIVQLNSGIASPTASWNVGISPPSILGYDLGYDNAMIGGEGITAVKSCDGYWILTTGRKNNGQFYITVFSLTASGLAFHSEILSPFTTNQQSLEASRDGSRVAIGSGTNGSLQTAGLATFDFDIFTGTLSNQLVLNNFKSYGYSFSPDSRLLYCSGWSSSNLYQYDMLDPSPATSGIVVSNSASYACEMQLGPDDKLYLSSGTTYVQVVHQPNVRSTTVNPNACFYTPTGPQMQTTLTHSLPNMVDATGYSVFSNTMTVTQISCLEYAFDNSLCSGTFSWNFGDPASGASNTSALQNPTHVFSAPGTYTITVTGGGTTLTSTVMIGTSSAISGSPTICLENNPTGNYATNLQPGQVAQWSVSGGGISGLDNQPDVNVVWTTLPGTVTLTVTDPETTCSSTTTFVVTEYCETCTCTLDPSLNFSIDNNTCEVTFTGEHGGGTCLQNVTYTWDLDGVSATGSAVSYTFPTNGLHTACLTVTATVNGQSCSQQICQTLETNCTQPCDCKLKPEYTYSVDTKECLYSFKGYTGGPACLEFVEFHWDFGDGTTGTGQYPDHTFTATGLFDVCLTVIVRDADGKVLCEDTYCKKIEVPCKGDCECKLKPEFTYSVDEKDCIYIFEGISGGPNCLQFVEYHWDFGDGKTSMGQTAGHVYDATGSYDVCLTVIVRNDKGEIQCEEKFCDKVDVRCKGRCDCTLDPVYTMTKIGSCEFLFTGFSGSNCVNIDKIVWVVNDIEVGQGENFIFQFEVNQSYVICMIVYGSLNNGEACEKKYCQEFFYTDCYPFPFGLKSNNQAGASDVQLYPNPTNDQFQLKFTDSFDGKIEVTLKAMDGKVIGNEIYTRPDGTSELTVQLPETISSGFILVEVKAGNRVYTEKLMVLKK
jgi:PKD repeat protein